MQGPVECCSPVRLSCHLRSTTTAASVACRACWEGSLPENGIPLRCYELLRIILMCQSARSRLQRHRQLHPARLRLVRVAVAVLFGCKCHAQDEDDFTAEESGNKHSLTRCLCSLRCRVRLSRCEEQRLEQESEEAHVFGACKRSSKGRPRGCSSPKEDVISPKATQISAILLWHWWLVSDLPVSFPKRSEQHKPLKQKTGFQDKTWRIIALRMA